MEKTEIIKELNTLIKKIEFSNKKIIELENLIKYEFKEGRYGDRNNCNSVMNFTVDGYLSQKFRVNMSNNIANALSELLLIAISEENECLKIFKEEYDKLLLKLK